ncbi:MAG: hypothetical protein J6N45_05505 [Alphaproteobacteria bacterium]|nr:hypothetical protein [Alphaproteobacteria bacterium]
MTDEISKAKIGTMSSIVKAFYHDFMPMIEQIKTGVATLHISEQDKETLGRINEQLRQAESLLRQLKTISAKRTREQTINALKDMFVPGEITTFPYTLQGPIAIVSDNGNYVRCPAWGAGKTIIKFDKNFVYMKSDTAGKVDLFNSEGIKVMEIDEEKIK